MTLNAKLFKRAALIVAIFAIFSYTAHIATPQGILTGLKIFGAVIVVSVIALSAILSYDLYTGYKREKHLLIEKKRTRDILRAEKEIEAWANNPFDNYNSAFTTDGDLTVRLGRLTGVEFFNRIEDYRNDFNR